MVDPGNGRLDKRERTFRRVALFWIILCIVVIVATTAFCFYAADWPLFDYGRGGPDAVIFAA